MAQFNITKNLNGIEGLHLINPPVYKDERGYFSETYNKKSLEELGVNCVFVQDNQSSSVKGVLRGLHFQKRYAQCKLVRVISGEVFDVAVDLRKNSSTYGNWHGEILSAENRNQLLIPEGFAHGFLVLSDVAEFCYKVTDFYHPNDEDGIAWNDPDIAIKWPGISGEYKGTAFSKSYCFSGKKLTISVKDQNWKTLKELSSKF